VTEAKKGRACVLFDLDGTLTDPAEGIVGGVVFAMQKAGVPIPSRAVLESFIGPPLVDQFIAVCGVDNPTAQRMLGWYRDYFDPKGMLENKTYDGILPLCAALKEAGAVVAMATSKPEIYAVKILEHFGLAPYFDYMCGSTMDETRVKKADVLAYALAQMGVTANDRVVMVGDRCYDVEGAACHNIPCVGVLYGYGDRAELEKAGAAAIVEDVPALHRWLMQFVSESD
jgi:phosphoglycolate phosphatase